ncbi:YceI family protein [Arthrobacter woluwensis]|uniref:Polyisoprenoid-binding protein YceI n=1 Tax=Arthrobacter woluwensis TaxID=156980 RepID=A0A1H4LFL0_9MICC|nr:YceI family protein [Arthrobacter woluwensis]PSS44446.1 polyisoprenoid-binding protein [Arthrobacter woluwensis]SEB69523.1 Polyisoprenoid-binding protein YceI [Arthrobacter woluwensis]
MSIPTNLTPGTWTLDPSHSEAAWTVRHAGISKVRGTFGDLAATVTVTDNDAVVDATIQSASISTGDANRDGHVKGEDFFDVENHPTLTFKSTSLEGDGEDYKLNGELTIKGVSVPVTFDAEFGGVAVDPFGNTRAGVSAETTISRKEFGLTWNAALEAGGVLVSDKVKINLELSFLAPSAS